MYLNGKVALITGGASGIGHAIAKRFLGAGGRVVIADLNLAGAAQAARELADAKSAIGVGMDVSKEIEVDAGVQRTIDAFGRIDSLVSNAGIQIVYPIEDFPFADWKKLIHLSRRCIPNDQGVHQAHVQAELGHAHFYRLGAQL